MNLMMSNMWSTAIVKIITTTHTVTTTVQWGEKQSEGVPFC